MNNTTHTKEGCNMSEVTYRTGTQIGNNESAMELASTTILMSSPPCPSRISVLDIDILEEDPVPTFVVKIGAEAIPFEILFCNESFRKGNFKDTILATTRPARLFRFWCEALSFQKTHDFDGCAWAAEVAGREGNWKVVRAADSVPSDHTMDDYCTVGSDFSSAKSCRGSASFPLSSPPDVNAIRSTFFPLPRHSSESDLPPDTVTRTSPSPPASWPMSTSMEIVSSMLEMMDVGVFEIDPTGKLRYANDAWFRLSGHAKDTSEDFAFMDLVHPEDEAFVMSQWNKLIQGKPVSFKMRWKPHEATPAPAQWVLASSCPVLGKNGETISISGITIDISGQKELEEAATARLEALESARLSERKFARFATLSPIAIYITGPDKETGLINFQYVNDMFFELTGHPRVPFEQISWDQIVAEEDIEKVKDARFATASGGHMTEPMQLKLKKTWTNQKGNSNEVWVQGSSYPELDENGSVTSIMGTLVDISHFKWAESMQRRGIEEALEAKRQADNFIDSTSHELRNPLSAVIQCADSVVSTLQQLLPEDLTSSVPELEKVNREIASCLDYIQIIISCSMHQRRLIDDVLTMSKLDSNLILVTPIPVQPAVIVSDAVKIFEVECRRMKISLNFIEDKSLEGFEWAMLDPSRLVQVLMNMLTNAIKFTKDCPTRKITVTLGASTLWPPHELNEFTFSDRLTASKDDMFDKPEWGTGDKGYVWIKVYDTGRGMNADEQKKLFARFSQASPRTHVKYGGSGLGLYISKSLSSIQGGAIGVNSEPRVGSTFAFFVGSRVAPAPANTSRNHHKKGAHTMPVDEELRTARLNILIVEDNLINQKVLRKELEKAGCRCSVAGNGVEALDWLKKSVYWQGEVEKDESANGSHTDTPNPTIKASAAPKHELDLILMDIEMPIMDGLACSRAIRDYENRGLIAAPPKHAQLPATIIGPLSPSSTLAAPSATSTSLPSFPDFIPSSSQPTIPAPAPKHRIPILAVSANARSEQVKHALAAGMDDAIAKPFRIRELRPKMEGLVGRLKG